MISTNLLLNIIINVLIFIIKWHNFDTFKYFFVCYGRSMSVWIHFSDGNFLGPVKIFHFLKNTTEIDISMSSHEPE